MDKHFPPVAIMKVREVGATIVVTLPRSIIAATGIKIGDRVLVELAPDTPAMSHAERIGAPSVVWQQAIIIRRRVSASAPEPTERKTRGGPHARDRRK